MVTPAKVLCLHGFLQNGKIFSEKSSGIRKALKKINISTIYLDGPTNLLKSDLPFEIDDEKWKEYTDISMNKSWWYHVEDLNIEDALKTVKEHIEKEGPYDGVLGFSQGGALAAILTNKIKELVPEHPYFKFSILISAYPFTTTELGTTLKEKQADYFKVPEDLTTKTLFIYGSADNHVPASRSILLSSYYPEALVKSIEHDGGHFVPNKKPLIKQVVEFVEDALKE